MIEKISEMDNIAAKNMIEEKELRDTIIGILQSKTYSQIPPRVYFDGDKLGWSAIFFHKGLRNWMTASSLSQLKNLVINWTSEG